jgi:tRNA (cmo5U34)-methyltransferase
LSERGKTKNEHIIMSASINLWTSTEHANQYLGRASSIPHRGEGESALLEFLPSNPQRVLDLGTGDGRLLALVISEVTARNQGTCALREAVAIDFSPAMLEAAGKRFGEASPVRIISHNLDQPLPELGTFDAVVSSFAIHHLVHQRKHALYREIYGLLNPEGVFGNLEHVASPTQRLHEEFLHQVGYTAETEDPSNQLLDLHTQLEWLREIGFADVDCHWKWRELALMVGRKGS